MNVARRKPPDEAGDGAEHRRKQAAQQQHMRGVEGVHYGSPVFFQVFLYVVDRYHTRIRTMRRIHSAPITIRDRMISVIINPAGSRHSAARNWGFIACITPPAKAGNK